MRIFLIWADGSPAIIDLILELKKRRHEVSYWVGLPSDRSQIPDVIYHNHFAAWAGNPAEGINAIEFPPPSKSLIEKMYKTESLVLTMMDKKFDTLGVNERRHIYYKMLGYWYGVIEKFQPEAIIFPTVPHTVYNFIIYDLAKMLGIKTLMFEDTWVLDHLLMYEDWREGSRNLQKTVEKNRNKNFSPDDLGEDLKDYFLKQTNPTKDSTPVYMSHWRKKYSGANAFISKFKNVMSSLKDGTFFKKVARFTVKKFQLNLKKEYEKLVSPADFNKKFVYVPLNFQPERTTSPQGDVFVDQLLMVETLSAALPKEWVIYVKEHPSQWWLRSGTNYSSVRYRGYYERLTRISNVKLVPIHTNSFELIKRSQAVATITGTAGWESLLRLKPTLIFGYPWYRDCPEVFRISDTESCKNALQEITNGHKVNQQEMINFLKSLSDTAVRGYVEGFVDRVSKISGEDNLKNLTKIVANWVDSKKNENI